MAKPKPPVTAAIRALRAGKVAFELHEYEYVPQGGTRASSQALGVDEHRVIKTLVFEDEARTPLIVLMHGDREVSTKQLARVLDRKRVSPAEASAAERHTGYQFGGTSPFGLRRPLAIHAEASIFALDRIYINAGRRGLLAELAPIELDRLLAPLHVEVAR